MATKRTSKRAKPAPKDLDAPAKRLWRDLIATARAWGVWDTIDAEAIEDVCRCDMLIRDCRKKRAGETLSVGYRGQPVAHPLLKVEREAARDKLALLHALRLTPQARGVEPREPPKNSKFGFSLDPDDPFDT